MCLLCLVAAAQAFITGFTRVAAALRFHFDAGKFTSHAALVVAAAGDTAANGLASGFGFGHILFLPFHWSPLACADTSALMQDIFGKKRSSGCAAAV